jgi:hypothetical protein
MHRPHLRKMQRNGPYVLSFLFFSYFSILSLINKYLHYTRLDFCHVGVICALIGQLGSRRVLDLLPLT